MTDGHVTSSHSRFTVNPVLFMSTVMLAVTLSLIPLCDLITLLALVMAVMGFFMGIIDTVANVSMIALYGKMVAPFLQVYLLIVQSSICQSRINDAWSVSPVTAN